MTINILPSIADSSCNICLSDIAPGESSAQHTSLGKHTHSFHPECLRSWITTDRPAQTDPLCPKCFEPIPPDAMMSFREKITSPKIRTGMKIGAALGAMSSGFMSLLGVPFAYLDIYRHNTRSFSQGFIENASTIIPLAIGGILCGILYVEAVLENPPPILRNTRAQKSLLATTSIVAMLASTAIDLMPWPYACMFTMGASAVFGGWYALSNRGR